MINVRKAKKDEVLKIYELCSEVKKYYSLWDDEYPLLENFQESFDMDGLFVLEKDKEIIGSIGIEESEYPDYVSLTRFFIVKEYQRQGYGRLLFEGAEKLLKGRYQDLELLVNTMHPYAFKMYESFGYTDLGEVSVPWETIYKYHRFIKANN